MSIKKKMLLVALTAIFISPGKVIAQDCLGNLEEATRSYYNGKFSDVLSLLENCGYTSADKDVKSDVLELLIKSHLLLENIAEADAYMLELLRLDPLFMPRTNDILLFRELYDSYDIINKRNFGFIAGLNAPNFEILKYQSLASVVKEPSYYNYSVGPLVGIKADFLIRKHFFIGAGMLYQQFSYSYSELLLEYQQLDVDEKLNILDIPVALHYEVPIKSWKFFINAGVAFHVLLKSKMGLDFRVTATEIPVPYAGVPYKTDNYNNSAQRKPFTFNYTAGGGFRKSIGMYQIEFAVNYEYGINNLVKTEYRYTDNTLLDTYAYVPDDMKLNNLSFSVGVYKSILIPKKK